MHRKHPLSGFLEPSTSPQPSSIKVICWQANAYSARLSRAAGRSRPAAHLIPICRYWPSEARLDVVPTGMNF